MKNLYTAQAYDFNWWLFFVFICVWAAFFVSGFRNIFVLKKRFLFGDGYGMLFCFGFPISVILYLVLNEGYFANKVFEGKSDEIKGTVKVVSTTPGSEDVMIDGIPIYRSKYKHTNFPTHCWQGRFEDEMKNYPRANFRVEVVWVDGGNLYEGADKFKDAFPCILKIDVLSKAS